MREKANQTYVDDESQVAHIFLLRVDQLVQDIPTRSK